jgi:hypothetical protein
MSTSQITLDRLTEEQQNHHARFEHADSLRTELCLLIGSTMPPEAAKHALAVLDEFAEINFQLLVQSRKALVESWQENSRLTEVKKPTIKW